MKVLKLPSFLKVPVVVVAGCAGAQDPVAGHHIDGVRKVGVGVAQAEGLARVGVINT
jgi:hypothetical protein